MCETVHNEVHAASRTVAPIAPARLRNFELLNLRKTWCDDTLAAFNEERGLAAMSDKPDNNPPQEMLRHGLVVCHNPSSGQEGADDLAALLGTSHQTTTVAGSNYAGACTGSSHPLPQGGHILLAGEPYFRDEKLTRIADQEGAAAAIAQAYAANAEQVFQLLHGAFCCAVVDTSASKTLVAIDRLGQNSLYYRHVGNSLFFGTSASVTLAMEQSSAHITEQGIYNYIYFHMVPCPASVYAGLNKLQAGHYLKLDNGECSVQQYWLPTFCESTSGKSFESLCGKLKETLAESVRNTLPEQGKVGAFLSGGLDSSTVTGILAEVSDRGAEAFSIGFSAEGYDEMPFARTTAKHFGVTLNEYYVTPQDVVDALPLIAASYDEPFGNSSALPAYFCARMAAEHGVDTLLAGDGGDELFAGNERYDRQHVFERYSKVPAFLRSGLLEPVIGNLPSSLPLVGKAQSYIAQANMPLPDRLQSYNFLHRHAADDIFSADFLEGVEQSIPLQISREIYHRPQGASDVSRMLYLDWQITLADNDLRKVSHMCALAGVNVTYPMIDDALVDFSCEVPSQWKLKNGDLRHFYKEALRDWLPHETIHKTKQGFGLPFGVWMQSYAPLREMAYDSLLNLKKRGFIKPAFIDQTIKMHQSKHAAYYGELVWIFTVFELWMSAHASSSG